MKPHQEPLSPEELERMVHTALRALPARRAPASLEARVQAALERRAMVPWWHQSWSHWPQWVRAGFLLLCGALAGALVFGGIYLQAGFDSAPVREALAPAAALVNRVLMLGHVFAGLGALMVRYIPTWFLYAIVAFVAGLYAMLFGLGAAAYRTLWSQR